MHPLQEGKIITAHTPLMVLAPPSYMLPLGDVYMKPSYIPGVKRARSKSKAVKAVGKCKHCLSAVRITGGTHLPITDQEINKNRILEDKVRS